MALDSLLVSGINLELRRKLRNSKIEKIYQPHPLDLLLHLRQNQENYQLFLSAHPQYARVHLTEREYENPLTPPSFCMLLRKYLENSRLIEIEQPGFERIMRFYFQAIYPIDGILQLILVVEMMGKHSNIILLNRQNSIILGATKLFTEENNRFRQIYPGQKYITPPSNNKLDPRTINEKQFLAKITANLLEKNIGQVMLDSFQGFSPLLVKEILLKADVEKDMNNLSAQQLKSIWQNMNFFFQTSFLENAQATLFYNQEKAIDFSLTPLTQFATLEQQKFSTISELLDYYYGQKQQHDYLQQRKRELSSIVEREIKRCSKKILLQTKDLTKAENAHLLQIKGELILANLYQIKKGDSSFQTKNYYQPEEEKIEISLDTLLTPVENAQNYFKKYSKAKNSLKYLQEQITKAEEEKSYLEAVLLSIEVAEKVTQLEIIKDELEEEHYLTKKKSSKKKKKSLPQPLQFLSHDGWEIIVGRNNKENDYVTLKLARNNDLWLHVKDIPGSHVIIKRQDKSLPEQTLQEAAVLAAYYSKAKNSSQVPVDYTIKKNVKKPSGAKPGMVIYQEQKTIYVTPTEEEIKKLKNTK